jgi:hypothetical protein
MGNNDAPKAPKGWYPIAENAKGERYWTGNEWSGEVRGLDVNETTKDAEQSDKQKVNLVRNNLLKFWIPGLLVLGLLIALVVSNSNSPSVSSAEPKRVSGDITIGLTEAEAINLLSSKGFDDVTINKVMCYPEDETGIASYFWDEEDPLSDSYVPGNPVILNVNDCNLGMRDSDGNVIEGGEQQSASSWVPAGFSIYDDSIAYTWVSGGPDPCGSIACSYNTMDIYAHYGCPEGVYVEVNFLSGGVVVDWSNDTVPALAAGQTAQLQFVSYQGNVDSAQVASMSCY